MIGLGLLLSVALAQEPPAAPAPREGRGDGASARHHVAQARQFVKNKWYDDAVVEIEAALAAPGGEDDFDAHWLGAQVYYELVRADRAVVLAERAALLAPNADAREQASSFATFLRATFGFVELRGPQAGMTSRLQLESTSVIFDADLKRLINKLALELREPTPLPMRLALPEGEYLLNGVKLVIRPDTTSTLDLQMKQLGARGLAALQVTRLEVGTGTTVLFGDRVANIRTGGAFELSLTQPVGPLLIGAVGTFDLRSYAAGGNTSATDLHAWSGGLRVGRELAMGGPLALRPSVGMRYGLVPGIGFACDEADGALACVPIGDAPAGDASPEVEIYAVGRAFTPFVELSLEYREAGRTTALGVGVKAVVEQHVGTVASPGDAVLFDAPDAPAASSLSYVAAPNTWTATGIRLLANVSFAF
ncbi:MAG: hypothetical protein Q8P18_31560 [Pseudomonadota bacterium]|nr:hypothetical protein [Pseudomonadota bacterium]